MPGCQASVKRKWSPGQTDQVAPETAESEQDDPEMLKGIWSERRTIRAELLAIAAELEVQQ
jgi:hypothetical protein